MSFIAGCSHFSFCAYDGCFLEEFVFFRQKDDTVTVRNPYRWLPRKEENDEKKDRRIQDKKGSLSQEEHIKKVREKLHALCMTVAVKIIDLSEISMQISS